MRDFLTVHQSEDVAFTDLAVLNMALEQNNELGEGFLQNFNGAYGGKRDPMYEGFLRLNDQGVVEIFYHYDSINSEYGKVANVFGSFDLGAAATIASHLSAGKLVLYFEEYAYYVITPCEVETKFVKDIAF